MGSDRRETVIATVSTCFESVRNSACCCSISPRTCYSFSLTSSMSGTLAALFMMARYCASSVRKLWIWACKSTYCLVTSLASVFSVSMRVEFADFRFCIFEPGCGNAYGDGRGGNRLSTADLRALYVSTHALGQFVDLLRCLCRALDQGLEKAGADDLPILSSRGTRRRWIESRL